MQDDKKQLTTEDGSTENQKITTPGTTPATNEADKKEEASDWVAVGSGLGIDE